MSSIAQSASLNRGTEFNELISMTAGELEQWLKENTPGFRARTRETYLARPLVTRGQPEQKCKTNHDDQKRWQRPQNHWNLQEEFQERSEDDDLGHMRKVVSYCKRQLAQEETVKQNTNSKSYKSSKNSTDVRFRAVVSLFDARAWIAEAE